MTLLFIYLALTITISGLCSLLEATLLSSTTSYIESLEKKGYSKKSINLAKDLKTNIDKSISSILTVNTFANTMGASLVGAQAAIIFGSALQAAIAFTLTLTLLYVSEILPKTFGAVHWRRFIIPASYIISFMIKITYPFILVGSLITNYIQKSRKDEANFSKDEIMAIVNLSEKDGILQSKESVLIKNLLKLRSIKTEDIMTPRSVVFALNQNTTVEEAIEFEKMYIHSRIPVYNETIDEIVGMVFNQTILEESVEENNKKTIKDIITPVHFVSEDLNVSVLIDLFIRRKSHLFVVQDSYLQTSGIVTLEDALETLLGVEIVDEMDEVEDMQEFAKSKNRKFKLDK